MSIKINLVAMLAFFALIIGSTEAWSEEERPEVSADVAVLTKYVWRGYELSDESLVFQPSTTISYKGFTCNIWCNLDTNVDDERNENQLNETDITLSYAKNFGPVLLDFGYIYYGLDATDDSEELYLSIGLDTLLSPTFTIYRETAHLPAWYMTLGISHSIELPKEIGLCLEASVGYYYSDDNDFTDYDRNLNPTTNKYNNFHDGTVSLSLTVPIDKYITISPMIAYSFPLTSDADDHISGINSYSNDSNYFFGGITISIDI